MNKKKIEHANALRNCAKIVAWLGGIASFVILVVLIVNSDRDATKSWTAFGVAAGFGFSTAISYYTMVVLADISGSLAGENEKESKEKTSNS